MLVVIGTGRGVFNIYPFKQNIRDPQILASVSEFMPQILICAYYSAYHKDDHAIYNSIFIKRFKKMSFYHFYIADNVILWTPKSKFAVSVTRSLFLCVIFCRSLFVLFLLAIVFDLRILITPLVFSNPSYITHLHCSIFQYTSSSIGTGTDESDFASGFSGQDEASAELLL